MKTRSFWMLAALLTFVSLALVAGCKSTPEPKPTKDAIIGEFDGAPDWVVKGCAAYWGDNPKEKICGVGSMGGTANIALARKTAITRGRAEIADTLSTRVQSLVQDYQATVTGGENFGKAASDEQSVTAVSKTITDQTVVGTQMVDSWISKKSGTFYALVVMDMETFKKALSEMQTLDAGVRKFVEENAAKAFDQLDKEIDKLNQK